MPQAVDSFSPHTDRSCQALAANGFVGALRYQYNTSRAEVDRLHAHGLSFGLIFERNGNAAVVNPEVGADHGRAAVAFARSIGLPEGCAIFFAEADTMVRRDQYPGATRYWSLAGKPTRDAGYRVGAYGGSKLIDHLHQNGVADLTWETGAMSWNEWVHSSTCALRQLLGQPTFGGVTVDLNDVHADDWGQWTPAGASRPNADPSTPIIVSTQILKELAAMSTPIVVDGHQVLVTPDLEVVSLTDGGRQAALVSGAAQPYTGHDTLKDDAGQPLGKGDEWITLNDADHGPALSVLRPVIAAGGLRTF